MPLRFNLPGLGRNIGPLKKHQWQLDVAYRYLHTDQFYVGSEINDKAGPFGTGPDYHNSFVGTYAELWTSTNRINLALRFPFAAGTVSRSVCRFESSWHLGHGLGRYQCDWNNLGLGSR